MKPLEGGLRKEPLWKSRKEWSASVLFVWGRDRPKDGPTGMVTGVGPTTRFDLSCAEQVYRKPSVEGWHRSGLRKSRKLLN